MRVVLLGPPGAGKGTLAGLFKDQQPGIAHVSTGDILREEMKSGSPLGEEVKRYVESGDLVPDQVITLIIENKLKGNSNQTGFMLDGFPRTEPQAKDLDQILTKIDQPIDYVFYLEASLPVVLQRLTGRRVCRQCGALFHVKNKPPKKENCCDDCGGELYQRPDDNEETIKNRMDVYLKSTTPIIDYYENQGKLKKFNADQDSQGILNNLTQFLNEDKR